MESLLVWKIRIGKLRGLERMFVVAVAFASDGSEDSVTEAGGERRDDDLFRHGCRSGVAANSVAGET